MFYRLVFKFEQMRSGDPLDARLQAARSNLGHTRSAMRKTYTAARYAAAFIVITYGFAKLNGSQFTILESELDKPLGEVSGFWLTWYYFGYSTFYGNLIALAQILGGVMLMFRRSTLLGACLLLPVITNIILVDIFYGVDLGGLLAALVAGFMLAIILSAHRRELLDLFWTKQNALFPAGPQARSVSAGKYAARALLILIPAVLTYYIAHYTNRDPTPIDGAWEVVEAAPGGEAAGEVPRAVFYERNRAYLCVFKRGDGSYTWHHFEVDAEARSISIWEQWLRKGARIFEGHYELSGTHLRLRGRFGNDARESVIVLRKRD